MKTVEQSCSAEAVKAGKNGSVVSLPAFTENRQNESNGRMGRAIKLLRKERGISQEELAQRALVNRTTIARIECGIFKSLSVRNLESIAAALNLDLKALLLKAESMGESFVHRGHLNRVEFSLDYPEDGFRIVSLIPKQKAFFFGKIEIAAQKTVETGKLPHPEQICLHGIEGKLLLSRAGTECLLKPGDCYTFSGLIDYELYNPDQLKPVSAFFITHPSFLPV